MVSNAQKSVPFLRISIYPEFLVAYNVYGCARRASDPCALMSGESKTHFMHTTWYLADEDTFTETNKCKNKSKIYEKNEDIIQKYRPPVPKVLSTYIAVADVRLWFWYC